MSNKTSVTVVCGGRSTEHEISIQSAKNVLKSLDKEKYDASCVYITHKGVWHYIDDIVSFLELKPAELISQGKTIPITIKLGESKPTLQALDESAKFTLDCVFPMLHGTFGEDGCLQGLLEFLSVPYVGAGVLSSAMCMDKDITKQLLEANRIVTTPWRLVTKNSLTDSDYAKIKADLGDELFVKPVSLGSSVGITKVKNEIEFLKALKFAFGFDDYVMVEKSINGREIECAVLGNADPIAALPAEIISHHDFYSYDAKYLDPNGATTKTPADLSKTMIEKIRQCAVEVFQILRCKGMLRVDFFMVDEKEMLLNEVNTIPGFTDISLYPKMWEASGISYPELLDHLIMAALEDHQRKAKIDRVYFPGTKKDQRFSLR